MFVLLISCNNHCDVYEKDARERILLEDIIEENLSTKRLSDLTFDVRVDESLNKSVSDWIDNLNFPDEKGFINPYREPFTSYVRPPVENITLDYILENKDRKNKIVFSYFYYNKHKTHVSLRMKIFVADKLVVDERHTYTILPNLKYFVIDYNERLININ